MEKTDGTKEIWRIIGLFPDGESGEDVIRVRKLEFETGTYDNTRTTNHWPTTPLYNLLINTYITSNYKNSVNYKMYLGTQSASGTSDFYSAERSNTPGKTASTNYNSITTFVGSVGLIYPSDYEYAVLSSDCARNIGVGAYGTYYCYQNNWLYQTSYECQMTIMPVLNYNDDIYIIYPKGDLMVSNRSTYASMLYSPVMALKPDVLVTGSGTQSDPYVMN